MNTAAVPYWRQADHGVIVVRGRRFRHDLTCRGGATYLLADCECGTAQEAWEYHRSGRDGQQP